MDSIVLDVTLYAVKAILILDNDGERIIAKYYDNTFTHLKEQKQFEKKLYDKTPRSSADIIMLDSMTAVFRSNVDLNFYVIGSSNENEVMLNCVLNGFYDAISTMLRKNVEKKYLMDNLDGVFLALDEVVDGGIILETDSTNIISKVAIKSNPLIQNDDLPLSEQTVVQVLQSAKDQLKRSLLN
ncbi:Coatomer subunit zeta-1 [Trichoplax sp. H2]|uniref:Coatomer subunit zeta n=1 Tax=Trichoplax adhaerens TaxID=10228 RepID=B3S8Q3_TRIAD|nr:expressed hypothetical protein [Trichoplax adhaerens]EDV20926.1 expressed hypothetical protein [Trichoplax adhaerens]RDD37423.1 Coatomer subunit zeta-1 [Trichoplax sp. H2]|eukprot:XP_002116570.1 expressed hypothetical protein [Trichoplax adhaerens]